MDNSLVVLWTSGDREVAVNMVFMYTLNAKKRGWFDEVTLIIWGPSDTLLVGDDELKGILSEMKDVGVRLEACLRCAERYGIVEELEALGIDVRLMGEPLTDYLKKGHRMMTF